MSTTPNMSLIVPEVLVTTGPTYATQVNTALDVIDAHDHSPGNGVRITPSGLNINADLAFNQFSATNMKSVSLSDQLSASIGNGAVYRVADDLFYKRGDGTVIQITTSAGVSSAGVGSITGLVAPASATYTALSQTFGWFSGAATFAKTATGDLQVYSRAGSVGTVQPVTFKADVTTSAYDFNLPVAAPSANQFLRMVVGGPAVFMDLLGTNNQVTVTHNSGNTTLALPQNIHTGASPTFVGLTLSGPIAGATTGNFSGQINAGSLVSAGAISGTTGTFSGNISGFDIAAGNALSCFNLSVSNNITMSAIPGFLNGPYITATFGEVTAPTSVTSNQFLAGSNSLTIFGLTSGGVTTGQIGSIGSGFGVNIIGKTDGANYSAGFVGQLLTATMGGNLASSTSYQNLITYTLGAGVWEISAQVVTTWNIGNIAALVRRISTGISLTSASPDSVSHLTQTYFANVNNPIIGEFATQTILSRRINTTGTTIYLIGKSDVFSGGTNNVSFDNAGTLLKIERVG